MQLNQIIDARSPGNTPGVKRLPNIKALTSIRFFVALHVALYHFVRPFSLWGPLSSVMSVGYTGVSFFFVLSGFILTYSHAREYESGKGNAPKFWVARLARIYPIYLVSMIFAACTGITQFDKKIHILAFIADLLMIQSWSIRAVNFLISLPGVFPARHFSILSSRLSSCAFVPQPPGGLFSRWSSSGRWLSPFLYCVSSYTPKLPEPKTSLLQSPAQIRSSAFVVFRFLRSHNFSRAYQPGGYFSSFGRA